MNYVYMLYAILPQLYRYIKNCMEPFYLDWQLSVYNKLKTKIDFSCIMFRIINNIS